MRQWWKVASTGLGTEEGWRNGSSLSFPAPSGKEQKPRLRTYWASLAAWREGEPVESRKGEGCAWWRAGQLSPLWDPAVWKQTPCLPLVQPTAALPRTMAGYRPALTSNGAQVSGPSWLGLGQAGLVPGTQRASSLHIK